MSERKNGRGRACVAMKCRRGEDRLEQSDPRQEPPPVDWLELEASQLSYVALLDEPKVLRPAPNHDQE